MRAVRPAFTFIEIMVVLTLVGVIAAVLLPRLVRRSPSVEWVTILDDLNNMISFARQEAIANHTVYRLTFKSNPKALDTLQIEQEQDDVEKPGRKIYKLASSYYFATTYSFAKEVKLVGVYLSKQNMFDEYRNQGFCYVIPDGLVQDIIVHVMRIIDGVQSKGSYKMNPFLGTFEYFDGFIKHE